MNSDTMCENSRMTEGSGNHRQVHLRIGILGGTFDPIHNGHLLLAETAYEAMNLDKILLMPTGHSYFKDLRAERVTDAWQRFQMTEAAAWDNAHFEVSDLEIRRGGKTYTVDTLQQLRQMYPGAELFYICGADIVTQIRTWYEPEQIFRMCTFLVQQRSDETPAEDFLQEIDALRRDFGAHIELLPVRNIEISSTEIRRRVRNGQSVRYLVPESVERYIRETGLYTLQSSEQSAAEYKAGGGGKQASVRQDTAETEYGPADAGECRIWNTGKEQQRMAKDIEIQDLVRAMEKQLKYSRFVHSMGVCFTATSLAMRHGADMRKAEIAGILHDCAKYLSIKEMTVLCQSENIPITDAEKDSTALLHAKAGSVLARIKYNITDPEILSAIRYHTTGRANMTLLEKIIFVSDYIEPGRNKAPHLDEIRRTAFEDIDAAMVIILDDTLHYLAADGREIDQMTQTAYEYYSGK